MESTPTDHCDSQPGELLSEKPAVNGLLTDDLVDARPSEVDAKPIIVAPGKGPDEPVVIATEKDSSHYVLDGVKRVLVFNQRTFASRLQLNPRKGTDVDVKSIQATFKALDWEIDVYNDLTVAQIRETLLKEIQLRSRSLPCCLLYRVETQIYFSECSWAALAIFILSHGEDNGTVFAADYPFRVDHDILVILAADKCPGLAGCPKLVFVQVRVERGKNFPSNWQNFPQGTPK